MDPIDLFELDVLDSTADIQLAQQAGAVARQTIEMLTDVFGMIIDLPADVIHEAVIQAWPLP